MNVSAVDALTFVVYLTKQKGAIDGVISEIKNAKAGRSGMSRFGAMNEFSRILVNPTFNLIDLKKESKRLERSIERIQTVLAKHNSTTFITFTDLDAIEKKITLFEAFSKLSSMEKELNNIWNESQSAITAVVPKEDVSSFVDWEDGKEIMDRYQVVSNACIDLKCAIAYANNVVLDIPEF